MKRTFLLAAAVLGSVAAGAVAVGTNDAANSSNNAPQRGGVTAIDQTNDPQDIALTAAIRRRLVKDNRLSTNAKNVKVVTVGGRVFLRGPVESLPEKNLVVYHASKAAGRDNVVDQLVVR